MRPRPDRHRPRRTGLTMIELLVVILIIGILMAVLLPAVGGAFRTAKQAQVSAEINNLATALADFKTKYGSYPPSRLYCSETGDYSSPTADSEDLRQLKQRSREYIRKFWPRVVLSTTSTSLPAIPGGFYDFNGDGVKGVFNRVNSSTVDVPYILQGHECLAFFLGGLPKAIQTGGRFSFSMTGFGKNPSNPFIATTGSDNRLAPFYEFSPARLDDGDLDATITPAIPNNVPCYLDPLGSSADPQPIGEGNDKRPYAYFFSYGASSYDPNDCNALSEVDNSGAVIGRQFAVNFRSAPILSAGPNPYTVSAPVAGTAASPTSATFHNADSFQLISAGVDRQWGIGGQFSGSGTPRLPFDAGRFYDAGTYVSVGDTGNPRTRESDNISNFSGGRMD